MSHVPALRRAVFLDRDGTLNQDSGYVHRQEDWRWLPGVPAALARLKAAGFFLAVVSNQSGIARGLFGEAQLLALEGWVNARLALQGAAIDAWYHCPHLPEISGPCSCRKPAPGMLLRAAREWNLDLAGSWMVGDRLRDVRAGLAAGCRSIWLRAGRSAQEEAALEPDGRAVVLPNLDAACAFILQQRH